MRIHINSFDTNFYAGVKKPRKYIGLSFPSLGIFADEFLYDHGKRNDNPIQKDVMGKIEKNLKMLPPKKDSRIQFAVEFTECGSVKLHYESEIFTIK